MADDQRCSYPGKKCTATRAVKPNGTLHKLCELHRRRANLNQKRLQQKRRLLRDKLFKRAHGIASNTNKAVGKTTACEMLYAIDVPRSPTPSSSRTAFSSPSSTSGMPPSAAALASPSSASSVLSSPLSMDASSGLRYSAPMTYAEQIEYLFADPLLQPHCELDNTPEFSSEDVYMLHDALFGCAPGFAVPGPQYAWHAAL